MKHKKMEYCRLYESLNYTQREQEAMNENLTTFTSKQLMLRSFHQMVYNLVQNSTNCKLETGHCPDQEVSVSLNHSSTLTLCCDDCHCVMIRK